MLLMVAAVAAAIVSIPLQRGAWGALAGRLAGWLEAAMWARWLLKTPQISLGCKAMLAEFEHVVVQFEYAVVQ